MKIFVLVKRPFEDVTDVVGAFSSLEKAKARAGDGIAWKDDGSGMLYSRAPGQQDGCFLIYQLELDQ
jgi:hypothetical protein